MALKLLSSAEANLHVAHQPACRLGIIHQDLGEARNLLIAIDEVIDPQTGKIKAVRRGILADWEPSTVFVQGTEGTKRDQQSVDCTVSHGRMMMVDSACFRKLKVHR